MKELQKKLQVQRINILGSLRLKAVLRIWRMQAFLNLVNPPVNAKIIDLGGTPELWNLINHQFDVTIVNLPSTENKMPCDSRFKFIYGNACELRQIFDDKVFDVVFSNSVIEHVGDEDQQVLFSREVQRLADAYWVQTPSPRFPIEAHTGRLFYWHNSEKHREKLLTQWKRDLPNWAKMIEDLRVLSRERMLELFPQSNLYCERLFGIEKSNAVYCPFSVAE